MNRFLVFTAKGLVIGCVGMVVLVLDFLIRLVPAPISPSPRAAIVFTGQFDRIELGIRLFAEHKIDWLFISGANPGAGLRRATFARQFALSPELTAALNEGRIVLGEDAEYTVANAIEARCWLRRHPAIETVTLITSRLHMPRASLAFERALPAGLRVARIFSDTQAVGVRDALGSGEFRKFVSTWFFSLLPTSLWTRTRTEFCL